MERFTDQPLSPRPHLAVFGSDKVGNFVLTTPLLRGLKEKYPCATLDFFGGETTCDLEAGCPYIDARFSLYGERPEYLGELHAFVAARRAAAGDYDLAINCDEFSELNLVVVAAVAPRSRPISAAKCHLATMSAITCCVIATGTARPF
jgi:ADP-heptose:LPS heptosyltransferase